jgi:hypothetical protein
MPNSHLISPPSADAGRNINRLNPRLLSLSVVLSCVPVPVPAAVLSVIAPGHLDRCTHSARQQDRAEHSDSPSQFNRRGLEDVEWMVTCSAPWDLAARCLSCCYSLLT